MEDVSRNKVTSLRIVIPIISLSWHGGTRVLVQVANYLAGVGHKVTFLVSRGRFLTPFEFDAGVTVREIGICTRIKTIDYVIFLCCVPFLMGRNAVLLANFFVTYYPIRLVSLIRRIPYLYFVQDIESKYSRRSGLLLNAICNVTYRDRRIVAANVHLRGRLLREYGTHSRCISIGPGRIFYDAPRRTAKKYDIVYFLRREEWKGLDRFVRFLALVRGRLTCLCISQDESLRGHAVAPEATFYKPKNDEQLVECIDSSRVLLLTSYQEGFALPPLEGMARGLPTVLFRCGGPDQYIVDGVNAVYVNNEQQAVEAIGTLISDADVYGRMSREAVLTADNYRLDKSLAQFAEFVTQCAEW